MRILFASLQKYMANENIANKSDQIDSEFVNS